MDENEDDWFFESVTRYKSLNMFELEYPVEHVELTSSSSICVSCSNDKRHQLLELSLPLKLVSQTLPETIKSNDSDLKIRCGTFTNMKVAQVKSLTNSRKVAVSHVNTSGVALYNLTSDSSDEIKKECMIKCELESPILAVNGTELALSKSSNSPRLLMDANSGQVVSRILPEDGSVQPVVPVYIDSYLLAFCLLDSGQAQLYDTRDAKLLNTVKGAGKTQQTWNFTSLYECSENSSNGGECSSLGMVSSDGTLNVFNARNWTTPLINKKLEMKLSKTPVQMRFKPGNVWWVSVTGGDADVNVYHLSPQPELVFTHDGHRHVEGYSADTVTSGHVWWPRQDNLIISTAYNGTVQAWQFEDKRTPVLIS